MDDATLRQFGLRINNVVTTRVFEASEWWSDLLFRKLTLMAVRRVNSREEKEKVRNREKGLKWMKVLSSSYYSIYQKTQFPNVLNSWKLRLHNQRLKWFKTLLSLNLCDESYQRAVKQRHLLISLLFSAESSKHALLNQF